MNPVVAQDNAQEAPQTIAPPAFEITTWFNQLPIRITGSVDTPYFYASDIGFVLGIKNIHTSIKNFTETELVSNEVRARENIITYRYYGDELRRDDSVILLTENGVYRLIMRSRAAAAEPVREHIYSLICKARRREITRLRVMAVEHAILKAQFEEYAQGLREYQEYKNYNPVWYLFKKQIDDEPYKCVDKMDYNEDDLRDGPAKYLYLCTCCPNNADYKDKQLIARIYGDKHNVSEQIVGNMETLSTNQDTCADRIYMTEEITTDIFDDNVTLRWTYNDD